MSKTSEKIEALRSQISNLQEHLESLEAKQDRASFKRRKKASRKKFAKDPAHRAVMRILDALNRDFFGS